MVYTENHPGITSSRHVLAIESDIGVFDLYGIEYTSGRRITDIRNDGITESLEFVRTAGEHLGYRGTGRHVPPDGWGPDIQPLCARGVICAHFTPANLFPLPHSTSSDVAKDAAKDAAIRGDSIGL
ncbi:hypothetical protein BGZ50_000087 [Haplosporangium sp. Z 11]|nr:hypothetical protein BGZ50_000087 [Haplosporangium sp. Z 11]